MPAPAHTLPAILADLAIQRIVIRHGSSRDLAHPLLADMVQDLPHFECPPAIDPLTDDEACGHDHSGRGAN